MKKVRTFLWAKKWWLLISLLLVGGIIYFQSSRHAAGKKAEKQKMAVVTRKDLVKKVTLSGEVDSREKATLRFQTSGLLSWVGVKEGDWVNKYQAIASLDKRQLQKTFEKEMKDYMSERWDWEQGRADYRATDRWFELTDTVKRILEKNQFDLDKAVLDVELADLAVQLATLTTPIEGIVTKIDAPYSGVNVTPANAEFEIVNPKTVYFYAEADEEEVTSIKEKMDAKISLDAYNGREFKGTVAKVDFDAANTTGSPNYAVRVDFVDAGNENLMFRLRMEGEVEITVATANNVLVVPIDAISGDGEHFVLVVGADGKGQKRSVKTGLETEDEVEIVDGLTEGEKVISS